MGKKGKIKLVVKLPLQIPTRKSERTRFNKNDKAQEKKTTSKERVRKFREQLKFDPKNLRNTNKQRSQKTCYANKIKDKRLQSQSAYQMFKEKQRIWKKRSRLRAKRKQILTNKKIDTNEKMKKKYQRKP